MPSRFELEFILSRAWGYAFLPLHAYKYLHVESKLTYYDWEVMLGLVDNRYHNVFYMPTLRPQVSEYSCFPPCTTWPDASLRVLRDDDSADAAGLAGI